MNKNTGLAIVIVAIIAVAAIAGFYYISDDDEDVFRIGLSIVGERDDPGWCNQAYQALLYVQEELSDEVDIRISVSEVTAYPDMEKVLSDYAADGYDLVWGHGGEYDAVAPVVADEYPDVHFMTTGCRTTGPNLVAYDLNWGEMSYLAGILAGQVTESNELGVILGAEYPPIIWIRNAFADGAMEVNENVNVTTMLTGTFIDPAAGKDDASALIDGGVDVITSWADLTGLGVIEAVEGSEGVYYIAETQDHYEINPDIAIGNMMVDFREVLMTTVLSILNDEFEGELHTWGIAEGVLDFEVNEDLVSQEVAEVVSDWREDIVTGEFNIEPDY